MRVEAVMHLDFVQSLSPPLFIACMKDNLVPPGDQCFCRQLPEAVCRAGDKSRAVNRMVPTPYRTPLCAATEVSSSWARTECWDKPRRAGGDVCRDTQERKCLTQGRRFTEPFSDTKARVTVQVFLDVPG